MKKAFTLLLACVSLASTAQKITLALNLKKDSTYYLTTNANLTIVQNINGTTQTVATTISGRVAHKVTGIRDSLYDMDVQFKSMGMHLEVAGKTIDFNSDGNSSNEIFGKVMRGLLNRSFQMVISKTGRVVEMKNTDNLFIHMFDELPDITEAQKAQFKTQMQQSFGEKSIRSNFQDAFALFPAHKIAVNDKWFATSAIESVVSIQIKTAYALKAINENTYLIHGDAVIHTGGDGEYKIANGLPMRFINMNGTSTTELKLDKNTCWISESKVSKSLKGTVQIKDTPTTPGGMTFPMSIDGDLVVTNK